jgi:hypothetical protein
MTTQYVWIGWEFNKGAWAQAMADECMRLDIDFVAEVMGVKATTVSGWMKMYHSAYGDYPYPHMSNFMKFCNEFDHDPREFFMLAE